MCEESYFQPLAVYKLAMFCVTVMDIGWYWNSIILISKQIHYACHNVCWNKILVWLPNFSYQFFVWLPNYKAWELVKYLTFRAAHLPPTPPPPLPPANIWHSGLPSPPQKIFDIQGSPHPPAPTSWSSAGCIQVCSDPQGCAVTTCYPPSSQLIMHDVSTT